MCIRDSYGTGSSQKHTSGYPAEVLLNNKITLPPWCRDKNTRFLLHQGRNAEGAAFANFGITSVRFQRRSTMKVRSLMKPLSDVETSPFVRVGPTKKNEGAKERKKKVKDIIDGGLKYTETKFSKDFPVRTTLESKLFEKLKDRKIIKEGMTTQVLTGILPSAGNTDLDMLQLGATGSDLSYVDGADSVSYTHLTLPTKRIV